MLPPDLGRDVHSRTGAFADSRLLRVEQARVDWNGLSDSRMPAERTRPVKY